MTTPDLARAAARFELLRAVKLARLDVDDAVAAHARAVAALAAFDGLPVIDVAAVAADRVGLAAPLPSILRRQAW